MITHKHPYGLVRLTGSSRVYESWHSTIERAPPGSDSGGNTTKRQRKYITTSKPSRRDANKPLGKENENAGRTRLLERNRVAAIRRRQKKKEWIRHTQAEVRDLDETRNQLKVVVRSFKGAGSVAQGRPPDAH